MNYKLFEGPHTVSAAKQGQRCAMEWVAYIAGEKHSDNPACVDEVLTGLFIGLNDNLGLRQRQRLRPYLARTIGTRDDGVDRDAILLRWADKLNYWKGECDCEDCLAGREYPDSNDFGAWLANRRNPWKILPEILEDFLPTEMIELPEPVAERAQEVCAA